MRHIFLFFCLWSSTSALAAGQIQPLFHNDYVNMTYPSISGDYLVYSQRVSHTYQVVRLHKNHTNQATKDVSPMFDKDVVRHGIALANGDIAYVSNRLGRMSPWVKHAHSQTMLAPALFQTSLQPNHLNSSDDGAWMVFDTTLANQRHSRIADQFSNGRLHTQLLGQAWRIYHDKFWQYKSGYASSETGTANKFSPAYLYIWQQQRQQLTMLGDGFDADISADGKKIVFVRENNGNFDLWLQNTDGSGLTRLTRNKYADLEPSFSPDGKQVVFVSNRDSKGDITQTFIHTLDIATGEVHTVTSGMGVIDGGPDWFDDHTIIFHSNRSYSSPQSETIDHWSLWKADVSASVSTGK